MPRRTSATVLPLLLATLVALGAPRSAQGQAQAPSTVKGARDALDSALRTQKEIAFPRARPDLSDSAVAARRAAAPPDRRPLAMQAVAAAREVADLEYKREVFIFPARGMDPFASLIVRDEGARPRLSDLRIEAIYVHTSATRSMVWLRGDSDKNVAPLAMREGDRTGNFIITQIRANGITADVTAGGRSQRTFVPYAAPPGAPR